MELDVITLTLPLFRAVDNDERMEALCWFELFKVRQLSGNFGAFPSLRAAFSPSCCRRKRFTSVGAEPIWCPLSTVTCNRCRQRHFKGLLSCFYHPAPRSCQHEDQHAEDATTQTQQLDSRFDWNVELSSATTDRADGVKR